MLTVNLYNHLSKIDKRAVKILETSEMTALAPLFARPVKDD